MKRISESQYQVSQGELVQIRINRLHINHLASVVLNNTVLQPDANNIYEFQVTKVPGKIEFVIVTCTFLSSDPVNSEYEIFVQEKNGQQWRDRVVKKTDPPITWQTVIRFVVV